MCGFGLTAGVGNALTIFIIYHVPKMRKMVMGQLLLSLAMSGDYYIKITINLQAHYYVLHIQIWLLVLFVHLSWSISTGKFT
jgi:hypothetical protein